MFGFGFWLSPLDDFRSESSKDGILSIDKCQFLSEQPTDTSILHHAFISIFIALWAVITDYVTILMPILSYFTRFARRGRMPAAGIPGWKRSKY